MSSEKKKPYEDYKGISEYVDRVLTAHPKFDDLLKAKGYDVEEVLRHFGLQSLDEIKTQEQKKEFLEHLDYMRTAKDIIDAFRVFTHGEDEMSKDELKRILKKANPEYEPDIDEISNKNPMTISEMVVSLIYGTQSEEQGRADANTS